jgi:hypothetical protein
MSASEEFYQTKIKRELNLSEDFLSLKSEIKGFLRKDNSAVEGV